MIQRRLIVLGLVTLALGPVRIEAWPGDVSERIVRDALVLVPRSLADLLLASEAEVLAEGRSLHSTLLSSVYADLPAGRLTAATQLALGQEFNALAKALQGRDFRAGVINLGAAYRLVVDLGDPGVGSGLGVDARARATRREFYLFVAANRSRLPLVVADPDSMQLKVEALPGFLDGVMARAAAQSAVLRAEGQEAGRVLGHSEIDFRSPVFAVASTAYSRSVSAVAATWIAIWRSAGGDMTRQKSPRIINPRPVELH